jgi:thiol-disulfide isomerase/thioredoxin
VYRLHYDEVFEGVLHPGRFVEIIYNREDLEVHVERGEEGPVPRFARSLENEVYQDFVRFQLDYEVALSKSYGRLFPVRPGEAGYEQAVDHYESLQEDRLAYIDSISLHHPELFATRIINAFRVPVIPGSLPHAARMDTLKRVFFDLAPIDDPGLLHAPVYSFRIVDYLSIFQDAGLDAEAQQEAFIGAVDQIMVNVGHAPVLRTFVVEFLLEGFDFLGMEAVQIHLADQYLDEDCTSDVALMVQERMATCEAMQVGAKAPDFALRDMAGINHRLSLLGHDYVLVVFWASTCVHCRDMMPQLHEWYLGNRNQDAGPDLEVVAISIDSSEVALEAYLAGHPTAWVTAHERLGWNSRVAEDYHIYATPSLFLLDRGRRIISRPVNYRQFLRAVRRLE